jgi:hypothetical protein
VVAQARSPAFRPSEQAVNRQRGKQNPEDVDFLNFTRTRAEKDENQQQPIAKQWLRKTRVAKK